MVDGTGSHPSSFIIHHAYEYVELSKIDDAKDFSVFNFKIMSNNPCSSSGTRYGISLRFQIRHFLLPSLLVFLNFQHGVYSFIRHIKTNHSNLKTNRWCTTWSPQDLTLDSVGFKKIPEDDYIKQYQRNPELWPVEFFIIAYRRHAGTTQVLVRKSANGTSKYGVGTGVPVTRWMLSFAIPPAGYKFREPPLTFEACNFPEFSKDQEQSSSWTYGKIDIQEDAFAGEFKDPELEDYANQIQTELKNELTERMKDSTLTPWESSCISVVKRVLDDRNSAAAIQGTLRMSGLFEPKDSNNRHVSLGENAPDPVKLVRAARIYTMFPQMPSPIPLPSSSSEELKEELLSRPTRMLETNRDPHKDEFGRTFTHISTSNVSNTIHGIYFTLDVTDLTGDLDSIHAFDLFGTKKVEREWVSLGDINVLDSVDGKTSIGREDTKPTFISGFIVRQLVREGIIDIQQ
jgi:hypothetical protein